MDNTPGTLKWSATRITAFVLLALAILGAGVAGVLQTGFFDKFGRSVTLLTGSESRPAQGVRPHGERRDGHFTGRSGFRDGGHQDRSLQEGVSGGPSRRHGRWDSTAQGFDQVAGYAGILVLVIAVTTLFSRVPARRRKD